MASKLPVGGIIVPIEVSAPPASLYFVTLIFYGDCSNKLAKILKREPLKV